MTWFQPWCICYVIVVHPFISLEFKRPKLRHVYKYVVPEYAHRWRYLGALLGFKQSELELIFSNFRNDTEECCRSLLSRWLEKCKNTSWDHLLRAIDDLPSSFHSETACQGMNIKCSKKDGQSMHAYNAE